MGIKKELKPAPTSVVHSTARSLSGPQTHQGYQRILFPLPAFFPQLCICCTLSFIIPAVAYSFFCLFVLMFNFSITQYEKSFYSNERNFPHSEKPGLQ